MEKINLARLATGILAMGGIVLATQVNAMSITSMDSGVGLATALIGSGVNISNVSYIGAEQASGYFSGGISAGIGMESGIVLTNGRADSLNGSVNTGGHKSTNNAVSGNSHLDSLVSDTTFDATTLSFDFQFSSGASGDAYFKFVFGSDEYNEWVNEYSDVFAFFLDGNAAANNVALIPGTQTPVSIDNVNNNTNASYYNDNDYVDSGSPAPFEYDGFTDVITVSMLGLASGVHHLEISIADALDHNVDSGVFIEGKSFSNEVSSGGGSPVPEPASILLFGTGLLGLAGVARKSHKLGGLQVSN